MEISRDYFSSAEAVYREIVQAAPRSVLARDDVLDALGLVVAAGLGTGCLKGRGELETLPEEPEMDPEGLPMEMVYWRPAGFRASRESARESA